MAFDEAVANRVRKALTRRKGIAEKKMFGGISFLLNGNMCCGVIDKNLCLRLGEEGATTALGESHTRPMDFTGKPMKSMVFVGPAGYRADDDLKRWVEESR